MQVKRMPVPFEVWAEEQPSQFTSTGLFVAGSRDVAASTLRYDGVTGWAEPAQVAAWVAVPVALDVLLAAWMLDGAGSDTGWLADASDDTIREVAIQSLVMVGTFAAQEEIRSARFRSGYRTSEPAAEDEGVSAYFEALTARLHGAFYAETIEPVSPVPDRPEHSQRSEQSEGAGRRGVPVPSRVARRLRHLPRPRPVTLPAGHARLTRRTDRAGGAGRARAVGGPVLGLT